MAVVFDVDRNMLRSGENTILHMRYKSGWRQKVCYGNRVQIHIEWRRKIHRYLHITTTTY